MSEKTKAAPTIYRHSMRTEWGRGTLIEDLGSKKSFVFEDGKRRNISIDFIDKLEPVTIAPEEARALDAALRKKEVSVLAAAKRAERKDKKSSPRPEISFVQQLQIFERVYPQGFGDPKYLAEERGGREATAKELSREAAIVRASRLFDQARLSQRIDGRDYAGLFAELADLVRMTKNLAHPIEATRFEALAEPDREALVRAVHDLFYGAGEYADRFDAFVAALRMEPRPIWPIATIFPALLDPDEHVFVRPTYSKRQAVILEVDVPYDPKPTGAAYERFLEAARKLMARLQAAGHRPRDFLDAYTFTWVTQYNAKQDAKLRKERAKARASN